MSFLRLRTVRAKLLALVGLPIVLLSLVLPLLASILHDELVEAASERLGEAEWSFQSELDDDFRLLALALRGMTSDPALGDAIARRDRAAATSIGRMLEEVHPRVDVLFVDSDGNVFASLGRSTTPRRIAEVPALANAAGPGETHDVALHGCAPPAASAPPARFITGHVGPGLVIICEPIDGRYLDDFGRTLGLELGLLGHDGRLGAHSGRFPRDAVRHTSRSFDLYEHRDRTFAVARLAPHLAEGHDGTALTVIAAADVTGIRSTVARHLAYALGFVLLVAIIAIASGARVAFVMSDALSHVIAAFRKLEKREYVRVPEVDTADELEHLATGFNAMVEGLEERDRLRVTFGKYMTAAVVDHLMGGEVELGGKTLKVTILFTDIRGFTGISENMDAHALVALLNEYFGEMVTILMSHGGVVDKYIGDAIMAVFGAPVSKPDDAERAVRAALEMRAALARLNERLVARGMKPIETGIGIHTGEVVAGNIGSDERMEYTVIGDSVNLASRLESATKEVGVNLLVSADTWEETKHVVTGKPVREITVKGRVQPVMTYEITGLR